MTKQASRKKYRALAGMNFPHPDGRGEMRVEAGEVTDQIPAASVKWLLDQGYIEPAGARDKMVDPEEARELVVRPGDAEGSDG